MKKTISYILTITLCISTISLTAQISINMDGSNPHPSAMVDIKSTGKGLLIPRMTAAERDAISNPAIGLMVFVTDSNNFYCYNGSQWTTFDTQWSNAGADIYFNSGNVGIGTPTPDGKLDVIGPIIARGTVATVNATLDGAEGIVMPGSDSDYVISVQDGNGRIQHKWNASYGVSENFIVGGEDAAFIDINVVAANDNAPWIEFKHADGSSATAGDAINWNTQMVINQGGEVGINETSPDDRLHVTSGGDGTRVRVENTGNGWAGMVGKNTIGEVFVGIQGPFDPHPGEFHVYDNIADVQRMVISSIGNVGIDTPDPAERLDVNGNIRMRNGAANGYIPISNVDGVMTWTDPTTISTAPDADSDPTNEIQEMYLSGDTLYLTGGPNFALLNSYLDNTDNQTLNFTSPNLDITNGNSVNLSSLIDDADADPANEIQDIYLSSDTLYLTNDPSPVLLNGFLDNTDNQTLNFTSPNLNITGGNSVNLSGLIDDADADPANEIQNIFTSGDTLYISGDPSFVPMQSYLDNTDNQTLTFTNPNLSIAGGNSVNLSGLIDDSDWTASGVDIFSANSGNVGIGTTTPDSKLDVAGTIIAAANNSSIHHTLNGNEGIVMPGGTSDYIISVQDGNGRIQHKWNATYGTGETFVVSGEDAAFIDINATASNDNTAWIEFKHADGSSATAGDAISWNTQMIINQGGEVGINETSPDDRLHVTSGGNGTRVRSENTGNGWAGFLSKNTLREIFVGIQGQFDANPGDFHIYDNTATARRMVITANGNVGFGINNPSVKLQVNGSVNCTGGSCSSDIRWKKDVRPLENALSKIMQLEGVHYYWRKDQFKNKDFTTDKQIGLIAQEVEKVYPELIITDNEGYKSMDYMSFTAVLLEAVKEQQEIIDRQNKSIGSLQSRIDEIDLVKKENQLMKAELDMIKQQLGITEKSRIK